MGARARADMTAAVTCFNGRVTSDVDRITNAATIDAFAQRYLYQRARSKVCYGDFARFNADTTCAAMQINQVCLC
ncbi:unnamed protein product [Sphagnum balticum]